MDVYKRFMRYLSRHPLSRKKMKLCAFLCFAFLLWVFTYIFVSSFIRWAAYSVRYDQAQSQSLLSQWTHNAENRIIHFSWDREQLEAFRKEFRVLWMAPFWSKSGYGTEAISFVMGLENEIPRRVMVWQYGDKAHPDSVSFQTSKQLEDLRGRTNSQWDHPVVGICHSTPYTWSPVRMYRICPSPNAVIRIGRTMFESNSVPHSWVEKLKFMDQIWVPTKFHVDTFHAAGVPREKLFAIPEVIDSKEFDPSKPNLKFNFPESFNNAEFIFVSIFKWEERKGWKYLVKAFSEEFQDEPKIKLFLLTRGQTPKDNPWRDLVTYLGDDKLAHNIHLSPQHLSNAELPSLYKSANAFVIASNGEGWGRPVVEAMAMELPVIATNWSGPTEYLTDQNSYPLPINEDLIPIDATSMGGDDVSGHLWAEPSVRHLKYLMRYIIDHPEDAKQKGRQARKDMMTKYNTETVSKLVSDQLESAVATFVTKKLASLEPPPPPGPFNITGVDE